MQPEANAAIFRPPMSIAAAGPSRECVELTVNEIATNAIAMAVGPRICAAITITISSMT